MRAARACRCKPCPGADPYEAAGGAGVLAAAGVEHIVETCPGDRHGWVPSDSVVHDHDAAEHHYRALLGLFDAAPKREPSSKAGS